MTENNGVFLHLLDLLDDSADQFFNEFFSIYKPLSNDSKALFAVTFFMKNLHAHYMEKTYSLLKPRAPDRHKALNLVEMLMLLVTSKKENAVKLFNAKTEVEGERVSISTILNLMLADPMEKLRDCAANIISAMTESLIIDRASHIGLLNSYLVPEMAECIQKTPLESLNWKYYYSFIKLLSLCIDKDNSAASYNSYLITSLINYKILATMPAVYGRFKKHKSFQINFLQFTVSLLALQEDQVMSQLIEHGFLDILWSSFEANYRKENIVFSICLKAFIDIERLKSTTCLDYLVERYTPVIDMLQVTSIPAIAKMTARYRAGRAPQSETRAVDGQFSVSSSIKGDDDDHSRSDRLDVGIMSTIGEVVADMDSILADEDKEKSHPNSTGMASSMQTGLESPADERGALIGKRDPLPPSDTFN